MKQKDSINLWKQIMMIGEPYVDKGCLKYIAPSDFCNKNNKKMEKENKQPDKFQLYNRYREKVYLVRSENDPNVFAYEVANGDFMQYSYEKWPEDIYSVDPSGGPFISMGKNNISLALCNAYLTFEVLKIFVSLDENDRIIKTYIETKDFKINNATPEDIYYVDDADQSS